MCEAIQYHIVSDTRTVYFNHPKALLPVLLKNGATVLLPWGRRHDQAGNLPMGGWARLETIHQGKWDKYFPKPVKLGVEKFLEKDIENRGHWHELTRGFWVQGMLARYDEELRLYVVTVTPEREDALFARWPRIVTSGDSLG